MTNPFRSLKLHWRRLLNVQEVTLDEVRISTDQNVVPRFIRTALFKESYESHERRLICNLVTRGDRVLEIGTGIGLVSLVCARLCGPDQVLSYEANPLLEPIIRTNYALNGMTPNLKMRAITVDGRPLPFFRNDNIISSSIEERAGFAERMSVESDAIDDVIAQHRPSTIVMDVEGAEVELLSQSDLNGVRHIIAEVHPHITGEERTAGMFDALHAKGFSIRNQAHKTVQLSAEHG